MEAHDSSKDRLCWTEISCPTSGKRNVHISFTYSHYIITFGGGDGKKALSDIIVLDMNTFKWEKVEPIGSQPIPRFGHSACMVEDNKAIIFGGSNLSIMNETATMTIIDTQPFLIEWAVLDTIDGDEIFKLWHTANVYENRMYVFGGTNKSKQSTNDLWSLDLDEYVWSRCDVSGDIPCERTGHGSVVYDGKMYIVGGYSSQNAVCLNDIYALDIDKLTWQKILWTGQSPGPITSTSLQESDGDIFVFGGQTINQYNNDFYVFNITNAVWKKVETKNKQPTPRSCYSSVLYEDKLIIWGGFSGTCFSDIFYLSMGAYKESIKDRRNPRKSNLVEHLRELLLNEAYSDITFVIGNKEFPCHKNILSVRCRYFKNMFESGMQESKGSKIEIPDVNPDIFEAFLEFVYCDKIKLTEDLAFDLLGVSSKWLFNDLKEECEVFLSSKLTVENFVEAGKVSEKCDAMILQDAVLSFGARNFKILEEKELLLELSKPMLVGIMKKIKS